jgi:glycosyltransferase involved in cell wall biosynthesis
MRLLVLSPVFPDAPSDGDRLRLFHWLEHLGRHHHITLACLADPSRPADWRAGQLGPALDTVERVAWPRWRKALAAGLGLFGPLPINVSSASSTRFAALVDSLIAEGAARRKPFDAVFAYRLKMAPHALRFKGPRFLDYTDSLTRYTERRATQAALEGRGLARRLLRWQSQKLAAYEVWVAGQFDGLFVNAATDALALQAMAPRFAGRIHVAANGVDEHLKLKVSAHKPEKASAKLVFVGHLAYPPNVEAVRWFVKEVLPRILTQRPDATFEVIGGDAPDGILGLSAEAGVRLHGYQADTLPFLAAAAVSVCPVRTGAGRQNKLMEAFACGLPAVATRLAALGAEAQDGKHLLAADTPQEFADAVLALLQKPALGKRLAKEAAALVKSKYDWARNARDLESVLVRRTR